MDLVVVQLKAAIRRLLDDKGIRARVLDRVNRYGEIVVGIILERPPAGTAKIEEIETSDPSERDREPAHAGNDGNDVDDTSRRR